MTKEDKELLLKDLCARLPYGVKVQCEDYLFTFDKEHMDIGVLYTDYYKNPLESPKIILSGCYYGEEIKPYLFPLSSMTEEQMFDFATVQAENCKGSYPTLLECSAIIDWGYKHHFDVNNLIEKGLAIDATGKNIY